MMKSHLAHMIRRQAQRYGTREVFRYRNKDSGTFQSMSWNEFIAEVDRVAAALHDLGCRQGENIGIISANRPEWLIADMAIHTLGGVVVPFFANIAKEQMRPMVEETDMRLLFAGNREQLEKGLWLIENSCLETVVLFDEAESNDISRCLSFRALKPAAAEEVPALIEQLLNRVSESDLATIIYTSGTTGEPKGAMLGHDNFMTTFPYHDRRLNVTEDDVSLCFLPLSHIFERSWSYYMLHCGVVNVMLENPREVIDVLPVAKPTLMCTVPRFFDKTYEGIMKTYITWPAYKRRVFDWSLRLGYKRIEYERRNKPLPPAISIKTAIAEKLVYSRLREVLGGRVKFFPCSGAAINPKLLRFFHAAGICVLYG
ncbi:MAG: AMP-dependent synthetase/ligase, partial [Bacteroidota bacterium]